MPSTAVGYITTITAVLLSIFNVGMVTRMSKTYFDGMESEEGINKKKIKNQIKALIVVNCISALILVTKGYYT